eukprot:jgi/Tetstr1/422127/TSEL_012983.t1
MACVKKAADPTKATPADSLDETPAKPSAATRDTTTLALLLQALASKVDALSTGLDEQDNNKHKERRDITSDDDDVGGPRNDEADRYLTEANKTASRDEYRHLLGRDEARLTYLRRFKAKKALTTEEQVAERLIYSRAFDTAEHERSANVVDGLPAALEDKRLKVGLAAAAKAPASTTFKRQATECDTDRDKARKEKDKATRERREQQRREAGAKNRDKNGGKTGDKTRDRRAVEAGPVRPAPGVDIDMATGYFYAPADKLQRLARQAAKQLLQRATRDARWLPVRELHSLAGRARYMYLAIPAARFYLQELHDVVGSKWGGRVRITHQEGRDLQWWTTAAPTQSHGRPIHRHVETAYVHCDSSGYGWGAVLNAMLEARGFRGAANERRHMA